jgi:hypothetical protein
MMRRQPARGFDMVAFGCFYGAVFARLVAEPGIPANRPNHANQSEQNEYRAPFEQPRERGDEQRCQSARQMRPGEEDSLYPPALRERYPAREHARNGWPGPCFARAKEKTDDHQ